MIVYRISYRNWKTKDWIEAGMTLSEELAISAAKTNIADADIVVVHKSNLSKNKVTYGQPDEVFRWMYNEWD